METPAAGGGGGFCTLKVLPLLPHPASTEISVDESRMRIHRLFTTANLLESLH